MAAVFRRRFRLPVLGRLAWAWLGAVAVAAGIGVFALVSDANKDVDRIALKLDAKIERFAAPETQSVLASAEPESQERLPEQDVFAAADDGWAQGDAPETLVQPPSAEEPEGAIVITIDGASPARSGEASQPLLASITSTARVPNPDHRLLQETPLGKRPRIASDGRRASRFYALPFDDNGQPLVGIIVGGLGLNPTLTERAIEELPPEVTLAFAPYARDLDHWTEKARAAGHELMLEVPMETHGGDPSSLGPAALLTERDPRENYQRLDWILSRFGGYFGVTNYLGAKFSSDEDAMSAVLSYLSATGLSYVDDTGAARRLSPGAPPIAVVNRMVTPGRDGGDIAAARRDLEALSATAKRTGDAIGKAYAYDGAIEAISVWSRELKEEGVALAPVSAIVNRRAEEL